MHARAKVEKKKELVAPHKEPREVRVRATYRRVEAGPNAPKLIRLVRHPFQLDTARMRKIHDLDRKRAEPVARERYRIPIEEAFAIDRSVEVLRPTTVHLRPEPRTRLTVDAFLASREEESP